MDRKRLVAIFLCLLMMSMMTALLGRRLVVA